MNSRSLFYAETQQLDTIECLPNTLPTYLHEEEVIQNDTRDPFCDMFLQCNWLHGWGAQTFMVGVPRLSYGTFSAV